MRCLARCRLDMFISRRFAMPANVVRKSAFEPTSCTSVVAQPASLARTSNSMEVRSSPLRAGPCRSDCVVGTGIEAFHQGLEALQVLVASGQRAGLSACSGCVGVVALVMATPLLNGQSF